MIKVALIILGITCVVSFFVGLFSKNENCITKHVNSYEEFVEFVKFSVEKMLREQRVLSKRVGYYDGFDKWGLHFDPYKEPNLSVDDGKNNYMIVWRKIDKSFEIMQLSPVQEILGKVETFGKRTDRVINEVIHTFDCVNFHK